MPPRYPAAAPLAISLTEFRRDLHEVVDHVYYNRAIAVVHRHHMPFVVIISVAEYEQLQRAPRPEQPLRKPRDGQP